MIFIIMGVSGAGKTTVGKLLADKIDSSFYDADSFHSKENKEKMSKGIALTDADREPWLLSLKSLILEQSSNAVIACSALKVSYRQILDVPGKNVVFIYLEGSRKLLEERLSNRKGHYAGPDLLESQLETLEVPDDALTIDVSETPEMIVQEILDVYGNKI